MLTWRPSSPKAPRLLRCWFALIPRCLVFVDAARARKLGFELWSLWTTREVSCGAPSWQWQWHHTACTLHMPHHPYYHRAIARSGGSTRHQPLTSVYTMHHYTRPLTQAIPRACACRALTPLPSIYRFHPLLHPPLCSSVVALKALTIAWYRRVITNWQRQIWLPRNYLSIKTKR